MRSILYGPVSSWRLGRSLGVDMISTRSKTCPFDCIYCGLGKSVHPFVRRREFVPLTQLEQELESTKGRLKDMVIDYATFSGMGEPTLANNFGQAIKLVKSILRLPVAVLTSSAFMPREDVRHELAQADVVAAKLDAPSEALYRRINRSEMKYELGEIIEALKLFRSEYSGKLALQMMFVEANKDSAVDMAKLAAELAPDEVQLNTPLRPCAVSPLPLEDMVRIRQEFSSVDNVTMVYEASPPEVVPLDQQETLKRHR